MLRASVATMVSRQRGTVDRGGCRLIEGGGMIIATKAISSRPARRFTVVFHGILGISYGSMTFRMRFAALSVIECRSDATGPLFPIRYRDYV